MKLIPANVTRVLNAAGLRKSELTHSQMVRGWATRSSGHRVAWGDESESRVHVAYHCERGLGERDAQSRRERFMGEAEPVLRKAGFRVERVDGCFLAVTQEPAK